MKYRRQGIRKSALEKVVCGFCHPPHRHRSDQWPANHNEWKWKHHSTLALSTIIASSHLSYIPHYTLVHRHTYTSALRSTKASTDHTQPAYDPFEHIQLSQQTTAPRHLILVGIDTSLHPRQLTYETQLTMSFLQSSSTRCTTSSLRQFASSSRLTLLHPIPFPLSYIARPISRSIHSSQASMTPMLSAIKPTTPRQASIAQQLPVDTAAFEDVSAPAYISPVEGSKAGVVKEPRKRIRAQKAAIKMVSPHHSHPHPPPLLLRFSHYYSQGKGRGRN